MLWKKYNKCVEKLLELWKTYSHLNPSGPCDLCLQAITPPRNCQAPRHKIPTHPAQKYTGPS